MFTDRMDVTVLGEKDFQTDEGGIGWAQFLNKESVGKFILGGGGGGGGQNEHKQEHMDKQGYIQLYLELILNETKRKVRQKISVESSFLYQIFCL